MCSRGSILRLRANGRVAPPLVVINLRKMCLSSSGYNAIFVTSNLILAQSGGEGELPTACKAPFGISNGASSADIRTTFVKFWQQKCEVERT